MKACLLRNAVLSTEKRRLRNDNNMEKLRCDICGGQIEMQLDRRGLCTNCGTVYSLDAMREMFNGVKVSVTGSQEDVEQWRQLVRKYYDAGDFLEAERVVKKVMEALPDDREASQQYDDLQTLKYMDIKNGVLLRYTGRAETVTIPSCVSVVDKEAFKGVEFLRKVVIPGTVKELRERSFAECPQLESAVLSSAETKLGENLFANCGELKQVHLPADMQEIPAGLFCDCSSLAQITLLSGLKKIGHGAFEGCSALTEVVIPNSVLSIGALAFSLCEKMTAVTLPQGIKMIEHATFNRCKSLERVDIPDGVQEIGEFAFAGCASLKHLKVPMTVEKMGKGALWGCTAVSTIDITLKQIRAFHFLNWDGHRYWQGYSGPFGNGDERCTCPWLEALVAQGVKSARKHTCMYCGSKLRKLHVVSSFLEGRNERDCPQCYPEAFKK